MTSVLDSPVTANGVSKLFHLDRQTADEITHLARLFPVAEAPQIGNPDREQSLPVSESRQAFGSGHLNVRSPFDPAVFLFPRVPSAGTDTLEVSLCLFIDIVDARVVQRSLVSLQR